ncbi:MAG TPA: BON domain-containing protein [Chthonomonadales bacterium]|nr:BON domain-containing protein [Chthonomonadales bacterium]
MRIVRTVVIVLLPLLVAGCNPQDAGNLAGDTRKIAVDAGQALGSGKLAGQVNLVLALRKGVDMSGLHIDALDGVVTVSGHVRNQAERRRVIDTIQNTRGVDRVINKLRVSQ